MHGVAMVSGKPLWFVKVLAGSDNDLDYTYIGCLAGRRFCRTPNSRVSGDALNWRVFQWLAFYRKSDYDLPACVRVYHEGHCGRCGRRLTVPASISAGFGPEYIRYVQMVGPRRTNRPGPANGLWEMWKGKPVMWHSQVGDRILEGAEAKLFASALLELCDRLLCDIEMGEQQPTGVNLFDNLTVGQKVGVLATIAGGLLRREVPIVPLTAALEAGIGATFEVLREELEVELDDTDEPADQYHTRWREKILAVRRQWHATDLPAVSCTDERRWDVEIESIMDLILWDRDYEDAGKICDQPPEKAEAMRAFFGISAGYFGEIAADMSDVKAEQVLQRLMRFLVEIDAD
jgi:hypothetical protein